MAAIQKPFLDEEIWRMTDKTQNSLIQSTTN